jgi:L,D-transpeptidase YcbB
MRPARRTTLVAIAAIGVLAGACHRGPRPLPPEVPRWIRETVEVRALPAAIRNEKDRARAWEEMRQFYRRRNDLPAWCNGDGPLPRAAELIRAIPPLADDGLDVDRYQPGRLEELRRAAAKGAGSDDPRAARRLVDLDVHLTYTFLALAAHLAVGRLQPETLDVDWYTRPRNVDLDQRLDQALAQPEPGSIEKLLRSLEPPGEDYARSRQALVRYRDLARRGGWPAVPAGPRLATGARGPRVAALRARLAATGDLPAAPPSPASNAGLFDPALAAAVTRFQQRHGLEPTGAVDDETLAALDEPVAARLRQLQINMERWRWLPATLGERYVLVNVPEFRLDVVEGARTVLTMRVIVGKEQSRTPAFSGKMTHLQLNPSWRLPDSIVRNEIVPKLAADPGYLRRKGIEVIARDADDAPAVGPGGVDLSQLGRPGSRYRLRQPPGGDNPLGKLKFLFPNRFDVYLHDTPAGHLFDRAERDFSHGCIRIEKPLELAAYLLRGDPRWTSEALAEQIATGETKTIQLPRPIAVHILYWTAWVEKDGTVQFRKDIYGHDATLADALAKEPPVWPDLPAIRGDLKAARGSLWR